MSEHASLLVEQLWQLKRLVDRGEYWLSSCSPEQFAAQANYRADVRREETNAESPQAERYPAVDPGTALMASTDKPGARAAPSAPTSECPTQAPPSGLDCSRACGRCR